MRNKTAQKNSCPAFSFSGTAIFFVLCSDSGMEGNPKENHVKDPETSQGELTGAAERNKGNDRRETA
ncbi:hypothetical protein [Flavobacterium sandaracinum]|uniref:Uncharacterized protein n=1 Tax=Flavobacterium sandaracinum TaxID=2541733 RepID=A0A4R5D0Q4_9FLAO|nr:hypothetical protein [Flavobacterium sandaracinum]TDE05807.1 hypothetical protein E0F91_06340 [Flavobacterium sandaracinum]